MTKDKDNRAARDEEQVTPQQQDMSPKGGKGPDTPGAFGDAERPDGNYDGVEETLIKGPSGPEGVGGA